MKVIRRVGAQGDVLFVKVGEVGDTLAEKVKPDLAASLREMKDVDRVVVAHSETGHDHYLEAVPGVRRFVTTNPLVAYLSIEGFEGGGGGGGEIPGADVLHARSYDTHETLRLTPGIWEVHSQREYTPAGWRRVED